MFIRQSVKHYISPKADFEDVVARGGIDEWWHEVMQTLIAISNESLHVYQDDKKKAEQVRATLHPDLLKWCV